MTDLTLEMMMTKRHRVRSLLVIHGFEITISVIKHSAPKTEASVIFCMEAVTHKD